MKLFGRIGVRTGMHGRNVRESHRSLRRPNHVLNPRINAVRRRDALHDPVAEMEPYRVDGLRLRQWIVRERARAIVVAGAIGYVARIDVEAAVAAAVRGAREIVPADVIRQRDIVLRVRAEPSHCQLLPPNLGGTGVFDDLRAAVLVSKHRSSMPLVGRSRTLSRCLCHHRGPSLPAS